MVQPSLRPRKFLHLPLPPIHPFRLTVSLWALLWIVASRYVASFACLRPAYQRLFPPVLRTSGDEVHRGIEYIANVASCEASSATLRQSKPCSKTSIPPSISAFIRSLRRPILTKTRTRRIQSRLHPTILFHKLRPFPDICHVAWNGLFPGATAGVNSAKVCWLYSGHATCVMRWEKRRGDDDRR